MENQSFPYEERKEVIIKPRLDKSILPETGVGENTAGEYNQKIGASFAHGSRACLRGLSFEEEKRFLPDLVGANPMHQDWNKLVKAYWHNIAVPVPLEGLRLQVGKIYSSKTEWMPINVSDYVLYQYCLKYSEVANSVNDVWKSPRIRFYIFDKAAETQGKVNRLHLSDKAFKLRMKIAESSATANAVLVIMGQSVPSNPLDRDLLLAEMARVQPRRFIEVGEDKDILVRYFITSCVNARILNIPSNTTVVLFDTLTIGANMDEAVAYLKDARNSKVLATLKAKLNKK